MFKRFIKNRTLALLILMAVVFAAPLAWAENWQQKYVRFSATAGEALTIGDVVCIVGSDGAAYKADADNSALRPAVGLIDKAGLTGATVEIVAIGVLDGQTAASPGVRLFLSTTAGAMTTTGPTNAQPIGWVLPGTAGTATSSKYFIQINTPSSAGAAY